MYLAYKTYSTQAKNPLDKAFETYLDSIDRTLIENNRIEDFLNEIEQEYKSLSAIHNRCKPRILSFYRKYTEVNLHGSHVSFMFIRSKN